MYGKAAREAVWVQRGFSKSQSLPLWPSVPFSLELGASTRILEEPFIHLARIVWRRRRTKLNLKCCSKVVARLLSTLVAFKRDSKLVPCHFGDHNCMLCIVCYPERRESIFFPKAKQFRVIMKVKKWLIKGRGKILRKVRGEWHDSLRGNSCVAVPQTSAGSHLPGCSLAVPSHRPRGPGPGNRLFWWE